MWPPATLETSHLIRWSWGWEEKAGGPGQWAVRQALPGSPLFKHEAPRLSKNFRKFLKTIYLFDCTRS